MQAGHEGPAQQQAREQEAQPADDQHVEQLAGQPAREAAGQPGTALHQEEQQDQGQQQEMQQHETQQQQQQQQQEMQQQEEQQEEPPALPEVRLDLKAHPELAPLADAAFTLAALASSGLAAPFGLPHNDTLAVHCLQQAALAGGVDAQLSWLTGGRLLPGGQLRPCDVGNTSSSKAACIDCCCSAAPTLQVPDGPWRAAASGRGAAPCKGSHPRPHAGA